MYSESRSCNVPSACGRCSTSKPGYWASWTEVDPACPASSFCSGPNYTWDPVKCPVSSPSPSPSPSLSPSPTPSCTVILIPGSDSVEIGKTISYTASITPLYGGIVTRVDFSSLNTSVATVNPASVLNPGPYQTTATGKSVNWTWIQADVIMGGQSCDSDTAKVIVTPPNAWWQAVGGNVHANGGNVVSHIPATATKPYLITGTVAGLVSYSNSVDLGSGLINESGSTWRAKTKYKGKKTGYRYFKRILEDDPQPFGVWLGGKPATNGVFLSNGATQTAGGNWSVSSGQVYIILVPDELTINNNINVDPGGFLAMISSGNITINGAVTNVEGVYISDKIIDSGASANQLTGEGIFTGWEGFNLQRDLANNSTTPAEIFTYRPDLVRNAYRYLLNLKIFWQEVAP